ncbi:MAG TPA: TolC family protein, partial [Polyangiales bacterium]
VQRRVALTAAVELYLRSLSASALVEDASLNLTRRTRQQESIAELAQAGVRPPVDATRASVETLAARYVLEMRRVDEQASHAALAAAIGQSPERGLRPEPLNHDPFVGPTTIDEASRLARSERPELLRLREQIEAQQASYRAAWASRLPTLGLYAGGQATYYNVIVGDGIDGDQYNARGGLYMRWGGADAQVLRQRYVAQSRIQEAQRELEGTELSIRAEVVDAAYAVRRANAQLEQATQILEAARATRTAQQERYGAGTASLLELLDAEALEQGARRTRIEAQRDFDLARARLLAVCGTLGKLLEPR